MYAVIKSGGKQHKVAEGEVITIEKIDAEEGSNIEFSEVLAVNKEGNLQVGKPRICGPCARRGGLGAHPREWARRCHRRRRIWCGSPVGARN